MLVENKITEITQWLKAAYTERANISLVLGQSEINDIGESETVQSEIESIHTILQTRKVWTSKLSFHPFIKLHTQSLHVFTKNKLKPSIPKPNMSCRFGSFTLYGWLINEPITLKQWQEAVLGIHYAISSPQKWVSDKTYMPLPGSPNWYKKPYRINELQFEHPDQYQLDQFPIRKIKESGKKREKLTDEDFDAANLSLNILDLYESKFEVTRSNNRYRSRSCPNSQCGDGSQGSVRVDIDPSKNMYHCFNCGDGGLPLQFLVASGEYKNVVEAARAILNNDAIKISQDDLEERKLAEKNRLANEQKTNQKRTYALTQIIETATHINASEYQKCLDYLQSRNITLEILREAYKRKLIAFLPDEPKKANQLILKLGKQILIDAELLKKNSNFSGLAFRPILTPYFTKNGQVGSCEFRLTHKKNESDLKSMRYGKEKVKPWLWQSEENNLLAIVEGIIDALSLIHLGWKGSVICVPGIRNWQKHWAESCKGKHVYLMFDNDGENKQSIDGMASIELDLESNCLSYKSVVPRFNNDINEMITHT